MKCITETHPMLERCPGHFQTECVSPLSRRGRLTIAILSLLLCSLLSASAQVPVLVTLHTFTSNATGINEDGANPRAELIEASDGDLYGSAPYGGAHGTGTLYKMSLTGILTSLYSFPSLVSNANTNGAYPTAALVEGTDGNFYGSTPSGGSNGAGTLFRITPSEAFTLLHTFATNLSEGYAPNAPLIQARDGNFYGTTGKRSGGIFAMTPNGTTSLIHAFSYYGTTDGKTPYGPLVQGNDGNLYGTTETGGYDGFGTLFVIKPPRVLTSIYSFSGSDGTFPRSALVQGSNGHFYGTAFSGGLQGLGTVFEVTTSGSLMVRHSFQNTDGAYPNSMILGSDGNFYGTTYGGGANHLGTIFKMDLLGKLTTLHTFSTADGAYPRAGLIEASDGNLYGSTFSGGANNSGTLFCLQTHLSLPAIQYIYPNNAFSNGVPFTIQVQGSGFLSTSVVNWTAGTVTTPLVTTYVSPTTLTATVPVALRANAGTTAVSVENPGDHNSTPATFVLRLTALQLQGATLTRNATTEIVSVAILIKNVGFNTAAGIVLTQSSLGNGNSLTKLPISLGTLVPGATITVTLTYPKSVGTAGQSTMLSFTDTFTGGGNTATMPEILP